MSHITHNKPVSSQNLIVPFPKTSIPSPQKGLEQLGRGGKTKNFKKSNWDFQRGGGGGGVLRKKILSCGEGYWYFPGHHIKLREYKSQYVFWNLNDIWLDLKTIQTDKYPEFFFQRIIQFCAMNTWKAMAARLKQRSVVRPHTATDPRLKVFWLPLTGKNFKTPFYSTCTEVSLRYNTKSDC